MNYLILKKAAMPKALLCLLVFLIPAFTLKAQVKKHRYVVIGYVGGYKGITDMSMVNPEKLTHINYAFVNVRNNRAWLTHEKTDTVNFRNLLLLKNKNPDLKILISVGGWTWSKNFSDAALTDTSRKAFAASAVNIIRKYKLDGVDIDWEYPGLQGDNNVVRKEDEHNYTLMFEDLRKELDVLEKETGDKKLLTAATGGFKRFLQHTEMAKVASYLNYINLMTYDYLQDSLGMAVHHTNLFASDKYKTLNSADMAVSDYLAQGVPASKLVMGIAFYGRSVIVNDSAHNGIGMKTSGRAPAGGYTRLKDSLLNRNGFIYYRDSTAGAPYLFKASTKQFISFDDEWSVKNKCQYMVDHQMAGVMFWEYADDKKEYLLDAIDEKLEAK
ncbi:glycoside hydrolase family 18 protein [Mucilaginibacter ginsenosidivorax]|uniref:chitinase n=1 Tax=Mucilaginibacter ginsenosidivorax TaxID=862126 RepID=A0A5B8W794_9SPHI|nr:glycoside hydrolase family 18 protein [Mucilaginibacter ginsenosidivorax]QEC79890.1 glycoside hydrolase family 18 protein [Mucilaginibacter ginsenosidivorax]